MTSWTSEELNRIAAADELEIATPRRDATMRRPVPVWVVRHGNALYVRSYRGEHAVWYRSARVGADTKGCGSAKRIPTHREILWPATRIMTSHSTRRPPIRGPAEQVAGT
jgi:hypothetical protein